MDNYCGLLPILRNILNRVLPPIIFLESVPNVQGGVWSIQRNDRGRNGLPQYYRWRSSQWQIRKEVKDDQVYYLYRRLPSWTSSNHGLHSCNGQLLPLTICYGFEVLGLWVLDVSCHYHDAVYCTPWGPRQYCQCPFVLLNYRWVLLDSASRIGCQYDGRHDQPSSLWKAHHTLVFYRLHRINPLLLESW